MKRIIGIIITIMVMLYGCVTASATTPEDFEFVGGIHFRMNVSEVESALKKGRITYTLYDIDIEGHEAAVGAEMHSYGIDAKWVFYVEDFRVGGYTADGYLFLGMNGTLSDVEYCFYFEKGASDRDKTYTAIESILTKQYGETDFNYSSGKKMNLKVNHEPIRYTAKGKVAETIQNFDVLDYSERRILCDGEYDVIIQHHKYVQEYTTYFSTGKDMTISDKHHTKVSYSLCPKDGSEGSTALGF